MMIGIFLVVFQLAQPSLAFGQKEPADRCSLAGVTQSCAAFGKDKPRIIPFADGTYLINTAHAASEDETANRSADPAGDSELDDQFKLAAILKQIPTSRMTDRFKQALLNDPSLIRRAFLHSSSAPLEIPWPPDQDSKRKLVEPKEFSAYQKPIFSSTELSQLGKIFEFSEAKGDEAKVEIRSETPAFIAKRILRMVELVKFVRKTMIAQLMNGRLSKKDLSPEEQALVTKIELIKYVDPQAPSAKVNPLCQGELGNAFYSVTEHTFTVCQNILVNPDAAIVSIIAHEFAHAIDACYSQLALYRLNRDKAKKATGGGLRDSLIEDLKQRNPSTPSFSEANFLDRPDLLKILTELEAEGVVTKDSVGVPFKDYPLGNAFRCLTSGPDAFETVDEKFTRKFVSDVVASRKARSTQAYDAKADRAALTKAMGKSGQCAYRLQQNQMQEVMADRVAAPVVGSYLKANPPKSDADRLAPFGFFAVLACSEQAAFKSKEESGAEEIIMGTLATVEQSKDSHPFHLKRIDKIAMLEPVTRDMLNCPATARSACFERPSYNSHSLPAVGVSRSNSVK